MRVITILFVFICLLLCPKLQANVFVLQQSKPSFDLKSSIQLLKEGETVYSIEDINTSIFQSQFQSYPNYSFELEPFLVYWGKIELKNQLPNAEAFSEWVLQLSNTWTRLDIFIQLPNGNLEQLRSGTFVPNAEKKFKPTTEGNLIKLHLAPDQLITIYFRGQSDRPSISPNLKTSLQHIDDFYFNLQHTKTDNAIFIGFVLMMFLYNLILFVFGRDRSYIFYSIYLLSLVIYASFIAADLGDWLESSLFPNHPEYLYFGKFVIYLGLMSYLAFMHYFLDLKKLLPKWNQYFKYLFWLGVPLMILDFILVIRYNFSYAIADRVTVGFILLFILSNFIFLYPLFKTKDKKGYFIIAGVIFMGIGFLLTAIARGNTPTFSLLYFKTGTILEIIVFSLGLAYRQREIERAKQSAHFELERNKLLQEKENLKFKQLNELNQFKSRFYTNITHEFRTPLTIILGMTENIQDHIQEKNLIRRNSKNLLQLINQLLDLSKLESKQIKVKLRQGDIVAYLRYLTESFYSMATEKGIRLTFYSEKETIIMDYDEDKIQHIIYNLLSNAIKFTSETGKVILHLTTDTNEEHIIIKIKDTGVGIAKEKLPQIFDRFYQIEKKENQDTLPKGSGLGLALTKELIQIMKGQIEVRSILGKETEFTVLLPIEQNTSNPTIMTPSLSESEAEEIPLKHADSNLQSENTSQLDEDFPQLLLIEDNPDIVIYIKSILEKKYNIHTAPDGQHGIDKAIELVPDIIISDIMMPIKNGYEVCQTLKQDQRTSHIPIILLTAKSTEEDKVQGLQYGADAYLIKPFNKAELFVRLEKLIELRRQLQVRYTNPKIEIQAKTAKQNLEDEFIQKLKNLVMENIDDVEFGVPQLANSIFMSHTQVYRKLKALTAKTPSQFIRSIRLQKGMELLKTTDLNISEIAYDVGFSDPNYFSRTFQKEFGSSPSDIRN